MSAPEGRSRIFHRAATVISAGVVTGWVFAFVDFSRRIHDPHTKLASHLEASLALYVLAGAAFGFLAALVSLPERAFFAWVARRRQRRNALAIRALLYAALGAALSASTAFWLFTGGRARTSELAHSGPWLVISGVALGSLLLALGSTLAFDKLVAGKKLVPIAFAVLALGTAAALIWGDLTLLIALYSRLHTLVEAVAAVTLLCVFAVFAEALGRTRSRVFDLTAALALAWFAIFLSLNRPKNWLEKKLKHVWLEPVYAGRMLARAQAVESYLKNPRGWQGAAQSGLDRLRDRFDIETTALAPNWEEPLAEPPPFRQKIDAIRKAGKKPPNILIYYVDTLRADIAHESTVMPNYAEFAQDSLHFMHAYTAGSDTIHALPALTGGSYEPNDTPPPNDLLEVTRATHTKSALVISQSAQEFLSKERPSFRFDETVVVPDYDQGRTDVWGYGADLPSAGHIVDRTLEWLGAHKSEHFLLWAFNFDVHNWRELSDEYVKDISRERDLEDAPGLPRYRIAAAGVDRAFGRLLKGIDDLGLKDDTIVAFVSDHGEGVGRDGFWVHAIFLWESLVRVPLAIRIPGVEPKVVWDQVSLVDLPPTLTRYLNPKVDTKGYQGEDLLGYTIANRPKRRLPLLMVGTAQDGVRRIGMIEPGSPWKLVLQLESGTPELYDTTASDPDWENLSDDNPTQTLKMLSDLVRSPDFPRKKEDRDVKERAALATAPSKN